MNEYYILSPDELHDITLVGNSLEEAIANNEDMSKYMFLQEYKIEDCYIEQLTEGQ